MLKARLSAVFYGLILPHGLMELTIIFVAGGAGLRLGWSWITPGLRTRTQALPRKAGPSAPWLWDSASG